MVAPTIKEKLQVAAAQLQPLCEFESPEDTQFWDIHEIMQALRIANRHGIPLKKLHDYMSGTPLAT